MIECTLFFCTRVYACVYKVNSLSIMSFSFSDQQTRYKCLWNKKKKKSLIAKWEM